MFFGQSTFEVIFWVVIIISIFAVILFFVWFVRRSSRSRYEKKPDDIIPVKIDNPVEGSTGKDNAGALESENISDSLAVIKEYYTLRTDPHYGGGAGRTSKRNISKNQLKPHIDRILEYILNKLEYFRENYGKELIEENYILETVLKFGNTSIELIINYKAIAFGLKETYPDSPEKKSEVDRLFLGAADLLNSPELHEVIKDNTKK